MDLEAHLARAPADTVRCAEEPGRFAVTAGVADQTRENLEDIGNAEKRSDARATCKGVMGVLLSSLRVALSDRNASTRRQCHRQIPARRRRDGIVHPPSGTDEITARQGRLGDPRAAGAELSPEGH